MKPTIPAEKEKTRLASMKEMRSVTLTIEASEATMQRLATLLLFAQIPFDAKTEAVKQKNAVLPWEDPEDARFLPMPPTHEELVEQATKLITGIANSFVHGLDDVKKILASFGVARFSELPAEQLPQFIEALRHQPAPEETNADDLV